MKKRHYIQYFLLIQFSIFHIQFAIGQDTTVQFEKKVIQLKDIVVHQGINVPNFLVRVRDDSTFYKAFKNLHLIGYVSQNDIRINDKKGTLIASLQSKTRQTVQNHCRTMETLMETTTGDFYDSKHQYNYYTAELYAGLFFTTGKICNENNNVKASDLSLSNKSGIEKHKAQLKMLFFNPGKKIPGIPFIGDKINIFDDNMAPLYNYIIDYETLNGQNCYLFKIKARDDLSSGERDQIVIDELNTWFDANTMEVLARNYHLSYDAGVYDFDVSVEVKLTKAGEYLVPTTLRYIGNWKVAFKKRERAIFTAVLDQFEPAK